jgi:hypothetical protein
MTITDQNEVNKTPCSGIFVSMCNHRSRRRCSKNLVWPQCVTARPGIAGKARGYLDFCGLIPLRNLYSQRETPLRYTYKIYWQ